MDLNINELPERNRLHRELEIVEMPNTVPPRQSVGSIAKVAAFLAVVVTLTALAINSHHIAPGESTAASDTPPPAAAASGTLPSVAAPTDRTTTGSAPRLPAAPPPNGGSQ